MKFLDEVKIYISSGKGGAGCVSFRREANLPKGGPDGGNGGSGGNVIIETIPGLNTLIDFRYKQHFKAKAGQHGMGRNRNGAKGEDIILKVPVGTQVFDETRSILIFDLSNEKDKYLLAKGGIGGKGNSFFKSSTNQAPTKFQSGEECEEKILWLRLKLIADIGLVGLPNAGKSTFMSRLTASKTKIGDYPFTTLYPHLGAVKIDDSEFIIADLPGLIKDAHKGSGLGHKFLGHIERCKILLHLIDISNTKIISNYKTILNELKFYNDILLKKKHLIVLTKCDVFDEVKIKKIKILLKKNNINADFFISSVTGKNILELTRHISDLLKKENLIKKKSNKIQYNNWEPLDF